MEPCELFCGAGSGGRTKCGSPSQVALECAQHVGVGWHPSRYSFAVKDVLAHSIAKLRDVIQDSSGLLFVTVTHAQKIRSCLIWPFGCLPEIGFIAAFLYQTFALP